MKLLSPDQVDKTKDAYKGDVPEVAPETDAIAAPRPESGGDAVRASAKAGAKSAKRPAPSARPKKAKAAPVAPPVAPPPAATAPAARAKPAGAKERPAPKPAAEAAAQWDGSGREYIRRLLRTDQIGDTGILIAGGAVAPAAAPPPTFAVPAAEPASTRAEYVPTAVEPPAATPAEAAAPPTAAAALGSPARPKAKKPPARAPAPELAKQAAPRRAPKPTTPKAAAQRPVAAAAKAVPAKPARPAAKAPPAKARPAVRPPPAPLIRPTAPEPEVPIAAASPTPELIDRLQALGVHPRPGAAVPTPAPAVVAEADQGLLAGALALLLFLALVVGIYYAFSALFGGDEAAPRQPEHAAPRDVPYPRRPSLEDRGPAPMPWSQPGAADTRSYQGGGSGPGLNTTSRMPGARLDRPGDPPPGSPSGQQPYYQYGGSPYGTRTSPY